MMFERYVADQHRPIAFKSLLFIGSAILHVVLVIALIIYSLFHVDEVPPPPLTVTFISTAAPPPPPPPPPPPKKSSSVKTPKTPIVQPTDVKPLIQPEEKPPEPAEDDGEDDGEEGGVEGGVAGGVAGGVVGGVVGGVIGGVIGGTGQTPPPEPPKPKNIPAYQLEQQILHKVDPQLPKGVLAQHKGEELRIVVLVCITQAGAVDTKRTRVLASVPGTDEAVMDAIRQWRYKPQELPVCAPVTFEITVE